MFTHQEKAKKNSQCLDRELGNYYIKQELDDLRLKHASVPSILQLIRDSWLTWEKEPSLVYFERPPNITGLSKATN